MAKSSTIGLLKNVSTAAGSACPRQEAAQIIYNALTLPILQANALGVLVPSTDTILSKYLGGSYEVVVVTGNEYADLNGSTPLEEGKTEVNGTTTLNWSTELADIGSSFTVWTVGNTVIYAEDSGLNTIEEFTANANLNKAIEMKTNADTEDYVNFDDRAESYYTANEVITYNVTNGIKLDKDTIAELQSYGYEGTLKEGNTLTIGTDGSKKIKAGAEVTANDLAIIRYIFTNFNTDSEGMVVWGTIKAGDASNSMTYKAFVKNHLTLEGETVDVTKNENGNYVKVVDNDGDGIAEYILKTEYTMSEITEVTKKGAYILDGNEDDPIAAADVATEDELAKGDVIVYALIDGVYYTNLAEVVTETIDRKGINVKAETITCGENTYGQSYIDETTSGFYTNIVEAETELAYTMYLDNYGYVRLYVEARFANDFLLLTDGYLKTNLRETEYKAYYYDRTEEAEAEIVVADAAHVDQFITDNHGNNGTWGALATAEETYETVTQGTFVTNVANYIVKDEQYLLNNVTTGNKYNVRELTSVPNAKARTLTAYDKTTIQATTNTVYYLVTTTEKRGATVIKSISSWTGYANGPATLAEGAHAYVVTAPSDGYEVAQVVVIEAPEAKPAAALTFYYEDNGRKDQATIAYDSDEEDYVADSYTTIADAEKLNFYLGSDKITSYVDSDSGYAIYAGTVTTKYDVNNYDYVKAATSSETTAKKEYVEFYTDTTKAFQVNKVGGKNVVSETTLKKGDQLIIVTNGQTVASKFEVLYVIDVTKSTADLSTLVSAILTDATKLTADYVLSLFSVDEDSNDEGLSLKLTEAEEAKIGGQTTLTVTVTDKTEDAATNEYTFTVNGEEAEAEEGENDGEYTLTVSELAVSNTVSVAIAETEEGDED
jgi:hypothetical protein